MIGHTRIHGFELLRSYALILVVGYHLYPGVLPGGFVAVDIFFLLSGMLVTRSILTANHEGKGFRFSDFISKRFFRLFPAMAICVLISTGLAFFVSRDFNANIDTQVFGSLAFFDNWAEVIAGASYENNLFPHLFTNMWSLGVEFQWYIVWGILIWLVHILSKSRRLPAGFLYVIATLFALISAGIMIFGASHIELNRLYFGTDSHSASLFLGAALCLGLTNNQRLRERREAKAATEGEALGSARTKLICRVFQIVILAIILFMAFKVEWSSIIAFKLAIPLTAALACVLVYIMLKNQTVFAPDDNKFFAWLASRSYCIYLYHWPFSALLSQTSTPLKWQPIIVIALSIAISELTYRFIETPFSSRSSRQKMYGREHRAYAIPLVILVLIAGGFSVANVATAPYVTGIEMDFRDNTDIMNRETMSALDGDLKSVVKKPFAGLAKIDSLSDIVKLREYLVRVIEAKKKQDEAEIKAEEEIEGIKTDPNSELQKPTEVKVDENDVPQLKDDGSIDWRKYVY
jgi:peptidoglycan/LPS O-acetylase OafA/YrhL